MTTSDTSDLSTARVQLRRALSKASGIGISTEQAEPTEADLYVRALFLRLLEISECVIALADAGCFAGIPVLMRTGSEVFADLINLLTDPNYLHDIHVRSGEEWLRLIDEAEDGENDYLADLSNDETLIRGREEISARAKKARDNGGRNLRISKRFDMADCGDFYRSSYNRLCASAHNDGEELVTRLVDTKCSPPRLRDKLGPAPFVLPCLITLAEMLERATDRITERYPTGPSNIE